MKNGFEGINEETAGKILDTIYCKTLAGIPKVSRPVDDLANDYLSRSDSAEEAARKLANAQIAKCGGSGFITGLGGAVTLPVAIPANIGNVLYVQMRMIAAIAKMGGYDTKTDQVQTMVYICLLGNAASNVMKDVGIKIGQKTLEAAIKKIPGSVLIKINQKIGFRLLTKFGEKGAINLGKMIPVAGGVIGGSFDAISTATIASNAIRVFIKHEDLTNCPPPVDIAAIANQASKQTSAVASAAAEGAQAAGGAIVDGVHAAGGAIADGAKNIGKFIGSFGAKK